MILAQKCGDDSDGGRYEGTRSGDWHSYGRDHANTRANLAETKLSRQNVSRLGLLWTIDAGAGVTSTPAVFDGIVYFADGNGRVHAVSAEDGSRV